MFGKIKRFWQAFWQSIKQAYNSVVNSPMVGDVQQWTETNSVNLLAIAVSKLNNLTNTEATFEVVSDSAQADELKTLCKDLEEQRFSITSGMLARGDFFVFPATNERGEIVHSYLSQDQVRITEVDNGEIREAYAILDIQRDSAGKDYFLLRRHRLESNGDLYIFYAVVDNAMRRVSFSKWDDIDGDTIVYEGANHIGFGRYKSPRDSRGLSPIYGVPLNFGCAEIEKKIFKDLKMLDSEFENGKSVIFTDPRNLASDSEKKSYKLADNIIPIHSRAGQSGSNIEIFSPNLRFNEQYGKFNADCELWERQIETSKGILTENEAAYSATATAVKRANADTIALIDKIRNAIDVGNKMTLEADGIYLNVPRDLWEYTSDWYDPFEDASEQWNRILSAKQSGAVETADIVKWLFPKLSAEEIAEKIERIKEEESESTDAVIERMIAGK